MNVLIIGTTGLTGGILLKDLLSCQAIDKVVSLTRNTLELQHDKLIELKHPSLSTEELEELQLPLDAVFCCIGSTIKKAGSKKAFREVDYEKPLAIAKWARNNNVEHFFLISAMGASTASPFFYNKVKGEIEVAIGKLNFRSFYIFRPSLLLGDRKEKRVWEGIAQYVFTWFDPLFRGPFRMYRGIKAEVVAKSMLLKFLQRQEGQFVLSSNTIQNFYNDCSNTES